MYTVKRLYGRKSLTQLDLAKKFHEFFTFSTVGQFFLTNVAKFGHISAPQNF